MTANENKTFVVRLTRRMQEANISESELAKRMQIKPTLVRRWKRGNAYPQGLMMRRLAGILQVEENYLTRDEAERKKSEHLESQIRALDAEKRLTEGKSINEVIAELEYGNSSAMFAAISKHSKACPYTEKEQGDFRKTLSDRMREKEITRVQFSWSVGIGLSSVDNWLGGRRMPPRCLIAKIAGVLSLTGRELLGGPPLLCDKEKTDRTAVPEKGAEASTSEKEVETSAPDRSDAFCKTDGTLEIKMRYAAEGKGKHAEFRFDGKVFSVKITTPLDGISPEILSDVGEELQRAAVAMTKNELKEYRKHKQLIVAYQDEIDKGPEASDSVIGSMQEYPHIEQIVSIHGLDEKRMQWLRQRIYALSEQCTRAEAFVATVDDEYMRAILYWRYIQGQSWVKVRKTLKTCDVTANCIRMRAENFFKRNT